MKKVALTISLTSSLFIEALLFVPRQQASGEPSAKERLLKSQRHERSIIPSVSSVGPEWSHSISHICCATEQARLPPWVRTITVMAPSLLSRAIIVSFSSPLLQHQCVIAHTASTPCSIPSTRKSSGRFEDTSSRKCVPVGPFSLTMRTAETWRSRAGGFHWTRWDD